MLKVGLTGNIGSGKSTVSGIFSALGVPVYHADLESKKFLSDPDVVESLSRTFGTGILLPGGTIDTKALGALVFRNPDALSYLNSLLHPRVREDARQWSLQHSKSSYIIHEAAIIFESGFREEYDLVIYITCPVETAISRVMERDRSTREEILRRLHFQWEDEKKIPSSDFIISNDGTQMLIPQVLQVHESLLRPASRDSQ